jgi:mRNA-degrading endonuclease RelE of RelBE toxin-antitoxin system
MECPSFKDRAPSPGKGRQWGIAPIYGDGAKLPIPVFFYILLMARTVLLSTRASKGLMVLDKRTRDRIGNALKILSGPPTRTSSNLDIKKLKGLRGREDLFMLRIGKYRIIFFQDKKEIWVTDIIHRSLGYDW